MVLAGASARATARSLGVGRQTVTDWVHHAGVDLAMGPRGGTVDASAWAPDHGPMSQNRPQGLLRPGRRGGASAPTAHDPGLDQGPPVGRGRRLGAGQRAVIAAGLAAGESAAGIARRLGCARQTVAREINRGADPSGRYLPARAHRMARQRLARPKARKIETSPALRARVLELLQDRHSPRQIALRLRHEHPGDDTMRVSHEQIYQALHVQGAGSLRAQLRTEKALRSGRTARLPRSPLAGLEGPSRGKSWIAGAQISLRPPTAADRAVPGHWEGDLVIGGDGRSALITLVERRSRFLLMRRLGADHRTRTVTQALQEMVADLPGALFESITWDQGVEMAAHAQFTVATGVPVFFADPHSPWQRPTNENTNGLIREYFPKGTRFTDVTDQAVKAAQDQLNRRARVVLNGMTPAEKLNHIINGATTT